MGRKGILYYVEEIMEEIIDREGVAFLEKKPYDVYQELLTKADNPAVSRLVLVTLLAGAPEAVVKEKLPKEKLSAKLAQECFLRKTASDAAADLYISLLSGSNLEKWDSRKECGLDELCSKSWKYSWTGDSTWHADGGHVDCSCDVTCMLFVKDREAVRKTVEPLLKSNPYTRAEDLLACMSKPIDRALETDFDDYVNSDSYYEPDMEEYYCKDVLEKCCGRMGLKVSDYRCDASGSDYEPDDKWDRW